MSLALQVALFLASLAVIGLRDLFQHSHELISNVTGVSQRVSEQVDEVDAVVKAVRHWTERADRAVEEVGSAIEPPILTAVRSINLFRKGAAAFLQALFHFDQNNGHIANIQQKRKEEGYV